MGESLYVIDLYSLVFQVFHAIPEMTSPTGRPTNAVFGITRDLFGMIRSKNPTYLIVAADADEGGMRYQIYPEYKAHRSPMPEDLRPQIPMIQEIIKGFGIPILSVPGWEADDVIATVVHQAKGQGLEVSIVTSDKDVRQLLSDSVRMYNVRKNTYLGVAELLEDWGIRPDQVVDFQSLVGDSVDNIPGVPQIGPKKATALLQQFGTLDNLLANIDQVSGAKLQENLRTNSEKALISRRLAKLYEDLPLEVNWEAAKVGQYQGPRLLELFTEYGFRRFADEMRALLPNTEGAVAPVAVEKQKLSWTVVDTPELLEDLTKKLAEQKKFCVDLETTGLDAVRADIVGWAISWEPWHGYYIPVKAPFNQGILPAASVVEKMKPLLERTDIQLINQNIKYDLLVLKRAGVHPTALGLDTMVGDYLLDAGARSHGQDDLALRYLDHKMIPITALIGTGKNQKGMAEVEIPIVAEYASEDAAIAWQLAEVIESRLREENLWDLYWNLERPLIPILAEMEQTGIRVNVPLLKQQSKQLTDRLETLRAEIYVAAEREFNIDSPLQLREILFNELKLPVIKKTKTGPSTDQDVLEQLAPMHPLPSKLIEHRQLSKLKSTYLDALPQMVNPHTGRIHASFNQVVAATGRLSSSDPNLQNIPIRTEEGRRVRAAFVPEEGWRLVCADYSQIELRMLAHFSHDEALVQAFAEGIDIHTAVAAQVFGVDPEGVSSEQRRVAKAVNFGVIYGQSPFGLAAALGISQQEAAEFIEGYFTKYAGVTKFLQKVLQDCNRQGYVQTIQGRKRAISGVRALDNHRQQLNLPERTAVNTVIQGSAADLIKIAMIRLTERLKKENHPARLLLQIHDELVFETPVESVKSLTCLLREEMEHALPLDVPLAIDVAVGQDWLNVTSEEELDEGDVEADEA
ncbi:MAG: DNA polymerase I [Planctomycetales bacterium]